MNKNILYKVSITSSKDIAEFQEVLYSIVSELKIDKFEINTFISFLTNKLYKNISKKIDKTAVKIFLKNYILFVDVASSKHEIMHNQELNAEDINALQSKIVMLSKSTLLANLENQKDLEAMLKDKLKELNEELFESAYYDVLTKLPNRAYFFNRLEETIAMNTRNKNIFGLMYLDLDGFKIVNDTHGHGAGDIVLENVANRIKDILRKYDLVARLGGDEFAVIIKECAHAEQLGLIAEKIIKEIERPIYISENISVDISASIGITIFPKDGKTKEEIVKHADMSMYEVKSAGKGTFMFFNQKIEESFLKEKQLNDDLKNALQNNEFFLVYQPKIELETQTIIGVEALIRWQHPSRGIIPNYVWIETMENSNYSFEITKWVLLKAISDIKAMNKKLSRDLFVSVNFSIKEFLCDDFIPILESLSKSDREHLSIEILERKAIEYFDTMKEQLKIINKLGIDVSFDDFGTGNTSLVYLTQILPQELKIDRSFVTNIHTSKNYHIVKAILAMAEGMGINIIAEGAETKEEVDALRELGCLYVQGYYYSKPLSLEYLEKFIVLH